MLDIRQGTRMDLELILWMGFFVGGYMLVLGYLLRIAMKKKPDRASARPGDDVPLP